MTIKNEQQLRTIFSRSSIKILRNMTIGMLILNFLMAFPVVAKEWDIYPDLLNNFNVSMMFNLINICFILGAISFFIQVILNQKMNNIKSDSFFFYYRLNNSLWWLYSIIITMVASIVVAAENEIKVLKYTDKAEKIVIYEQYFKNFMPLFITFIIIGIFIGLLYSRIRLKKGYKKQKSVMIQGSYGIIFFAFLIGSTLIGYFPVILPIINGGLMVIIFSVMFTVLSYITLWSWSYGSLDYSENISMIKISGNRNKISIKEFCLKTKLGIIITTIVGVLVVGIIAMIFNFSQQSILNNFAALLQLAFIILGFIRFRRLKCRKD